MSKKLTCKDCHNFINCHSVHKTKATSKFASVCQFFREITNGNWLRSLGVGDMAKYLADKGACPDESWIAPGGIAECINAGKSCETCWIIWQNEERGEDHE